MNQQQAKPVNNITNKCNSVNSNKKNRRKRRKNRKQGNQSTNTNTSNPAKSDQNSMCTSQEIELKEACDVVNDEIRINTRTVTNVTEKITRRPNNFKALDPKRCSGSEYEEFNTPSCEYNPIVPKLNADESNIKKQWDEICDFENNDIIEDLDKLSEDEAKSIEHDDVKPSLNDLGNCDDDDDTYESTHEFITILETEECGKYFDVKDQRKAINEAEVSLQNIQDTSIDIQPEHSNNDQIESEEHLKTTLLKDQDVKRFLDLEDIENDKEVVPKVDHFSLKTNDSQSTKSEIIFTEDGLLDDIIEYKGYQTLELPPRTAEKSMKIMILGPNGSLKPLSETSITNVTSISCDSNIKSTSRSAKSPKNPLKKIWRRFKKNKSRNKSDGDIEELEDTKLTPEEEIDVKSQDNQDVNEECCLSISTKSEVKEIDSNQALNSYRLSLVPSVDPLTQSMNNTDTSDTEIIEQSEANHELPVKKVRIDCKFVFKNEIVVENGYKPSKSEDVAESITPKHVENEDESIEDIILQSEPSDNVLMSVEPCKIDQKTESTKYQMQVNWTEDHQEIEELPTKLIRSQEEDSIEETEPAENLKLEARICKIDYTIQNKLKTLSLPSRQYTMMKIQPSEPISKDDMNIVSEKVTEVSTSPNIKEKTEKDNDGESVNQIEPCEQSRIEIQLYKIDYDTEPNTNTINITEFKHEGKSEPVQTTIDETPFIEFDRMLSEFDKSDNQSTPSHEKVKLSSNNILQVSSQHILEPEDNCSTTLSSIAYLNDDHLFPDAITPTKVIEFSPLDSYDVPYMDDWRFDKSHDLNWGETLRKHSSINYQTYSLLNTKAPIASLESLLLIDPNSDAPSKSNTVGKVLPPSISLRAKKSLSNFLKGSGRTR